MLRELGRGGMATVYLARDVTHDRLIALKVLRAELTGAAAAERFLREIRIVASLQHPNILSLHDSGILELRDGLRLPFYTMPYVEGESLRQRLEADRKPTTAESVRIIREIADALAAAHAAGVVHRDLKPENVLLSQGHAMVSDFGIARAVSTSANTGNVTATGMALGTPAYMAPEQALGDEMDHRADLYSLGLIAYELFAGAPTFDSRTPQQMLVAHATVTPEPISKRAPNLDPALAALVMRLLEKRPSDRPSSATEVVAALDAIPLGGNVRRLVSRGFVTVAAAAAVVFAIGVLVMWWTYGSRAAPEITQAGVIDAAGASVAVLPFENLSGDKEQQYSSDGMSEQIMYALGKVAGLRVSPRAASFAYRGRGSAFREIGSKLRVAYVIDGSMQRSGNQLRINAQLINVASGNTDWSDQYQRNASDVFEVQDDISSKIVGALRARLGVGATATTPVTGTGTRSVEAYTLYTQGRYFYEKRTEPDLRKAETFFKQAIAKDSSYARAYAGLSATYAFLGISGYITRAAAAQPARDAANAAVRLDSTSAEAYASLGFVRLFYDWDCPGARQALDLAIALDPQYAGARFWRSWYFVAVNQPDSALSEARRGAAIDPILMTVVVGRMLAEAGRHEEALVEFQKALAIDSNRVDLQARIATSAVMLGRCDEALRAVARMSAIAYTFDGMPIGYILAVCNRKDEARALAVDLEKRASRTPAAAEELVSLYAGLGEKDKAFKWLERAYEERSGPLYKLRAEPTFTSLRSDPRFQDLVKRMGLP